MRDFYKVLGISSTASDTRIKSAFRRRAKAFHPDLNPGNKRAEERFKQLTQAYEVLRNAGARASYDAFLTDRRSEVRRRFARSATLMVASFMLTMGSALAVLALHDIGVPLWEGWRLAASEPRVTVTTMSVFARTDSRTDPSKLVVGSPAAPAASSNDGPLAPAKVSPVGVASEAVSKPEDAKPGPQHRKMVVGNALVEPAQATSNRRRKPDPETRLPPKAQKKLAAATEAPRRNPTAGERKQADRQWPTADEPFMALGATSR